MLDELSAPPPPPPPPDDPDASMRKFTPVGNGSSASTASANAVKKLRATPVPSPCSSLNVTLTRLRHNGGGYVLDDEPELEVVVPRRLHCSEYMLLSALKVDTSKLARLRSTSRVISRVAMLRKRSISRRKRTSFSWKPARRRTTEHGSMPTSSQKMRPNRSEVRRHRSMRSPG